jgi:hypothetical protein
MKGLPLQHNAFYSHNEGVSGIFDMFIPSKKKKAKEKAKKEQKKAEARAEKSADVAMRIEAARDEVKALTDAAPVSATTAPEGETNWVPWAIGGVALLGAFVLWRMVR